MTSTFNNQNKGKLLSTNTLKVIAIVAMAIDHVGYAFVPAGPVNVLMRFIGRITGPVMFFLLVEGYHHTKNLGKYAFRLFVFALISYVPFIMFNSDNFPTSKTFLQLNVIFLLLLGLMAITVRRKVKTPILRWSIILVLLSFSIFCDWGAFGFLLILSFDYYYGSFKNQAYAYCIITLVLGGVLDLVLLPIWNIKLYKPVFQGFDTTMLINVGMFLPIILLSLYNDEKGKSSIFSKWGFYIFYPLHMLIIAIVVHSVYYSKAY